MFLVDVNTPIQCLLLIVLTPVIIPQRICFSAFECTFVLLDSRILYSGFGINVYWAHKILFFAPRHEPQLSVAGLVLRMGSPRKLRNTTEVEEFCQGFRVVEVFVGGGEGGVVQGVINVCYRPRVRLCGEERARLGRATATAEESRPPTSGTVPPQSVQPLQGAGSLNLLAVSYPLPALKTSTIQKHVRRKFLRHPKIQLALRWVVLVPFLLAQALLPTSTSMPTEEHPTSTLEQS